MSQQEKEKGPNLGKRLSANTLVAQLIRDLDIENPNRRTDAMIEWVFEAEQLIGTEKSYILKECELDVENYRAELPRDYYKLRSVKLGDMYLEYTGRDFRLFHKGTQSATVDDDSSGTGGTSLADRRSFDSVSNITHPVLNNLPKIFIADGWLNVTTTDTRVGVAYLAYPVENGIPLVHPNHATAVTAYLTYKYLLPEYTKGKVSGSVYMEIKRRWLELCNEARGKDNMPGRKQADYVGAIWNNLKIAPSKEIL